MFWLEGNDNGDASGSAYFYQWLRNPYPAGKVLWKNTEYDGKHEAMVPYSLWKRASANLDASAKPRRTQHDHLPRGRVFCRHRGREQNRLNSSEIS